MSRKLFVVLGTTFLFGWIMIGCSSHTSLIKSPSGVAGNGPIIDITNPTIEKPAQYQARLRTELAAGYYTRKQYQVALEEVNNALNIDAKYGPAYGMLALIHSTLGDSIGAEKAFIRATEVSPHDPDIRNNFGAFLCERQRFKESVDQFEIALRNPLYQTPQVALRNAAECAYKGKDYERAAGFYTKLGQPMPEHAPSPAVMATTTVASTNRASLQTAQPGTPVSLSAQTRSSSEARLPAVNYNDKTTRSANSQPETLSNENDILYQEAAKAYEQGDLMKSQEILQKALSGKLPPSSAMMHLAMCIERRFANAKEEERYADLLLSRYPKSPQANLLNNIDKGCS